MTAVAKGRRMYDEAELKQQYRLAVTACAGVTMVPLLLMFVATLIGSEPGSETDTVLLAVFGVLALSPLVSVPIVRRLAATTLARSDSEGATPSTQVAVWAITEYALWEVSSLLGFVGFILSGSWLFFAACLLVTFAGYAYSFPRWSAWVERAQAADLPDGASIISE